MSQWRSKISTSKTVYTIFNKGNRFINNIFLTYNGHTLQADKNVKFLGVTLDPGLTFNAYVKDLQTRSHKRLNMLRSIKGKGWGASSKLIIMSYKVLIRSLIEYCPFTYLKMSDTNKLKL